MCKATLQMRPVVPTAIASNLLILYHPQTDGDGRPDAPHHSPERPALFQINDRILYFSQGHKGSGRSRVPSLSWAHEDHGRHPFARGHSRNPGVPRFSYPCPAYFP